MNTSNTALMTGCKCGWVGMADSHPAAYDLWLVHIFEATTEGHEINREMAVSIPLERSSVAELRTQIEALNRVERHRTAVRNIYAFGDRITQDAVAIREPAISFVGAMAITVVAGLAAWELWRMIL